MKNEPQSYGSQAEWLTGKTGQTVNRAPEGSGQSDVVAAQPGETDPPGRAQPIADDEQPARKVTGTASGAKRGGFFKERDYPE